MGKVASGPSRYPFSQKFRQNRSSSLGFRDKCIFTSCAEIQDGRQKWRENDFCENFPVDYADTLRVKNFVNIALSHTISQINAFYAVIHNGRQNRFLEKVTSRLSRYPASQKKLLKSL